MNSPVVGLRVASVIAGLVCLVQLGRLFLGFQVLIGSHPVPVWASGVAVIIAGALCAWFWKLSVAVSAEHPEIARARSDGTPAVS
jgi:hypothetical protein